MTEARDVAPKLPFAGALMTAALAAVVAYASVRCATGVVDQNVDPDACRDHDDCPGGQICFNGHCATLCNYDRQCADDEVCAAGVCLEAAKVGCKQPPDCPTGMMEHPECFAVDCAAGRCIYTPRPEVSCQAAYCRSGISYGNYACGERGFCDTPSAPASSCDGYACDAEGVSCLTSCGGGEECLDGYTCSGSACITTLQLPGESCSASLPCIPTASCILDLCRALDGQACTSNAVCASSICVAGVCQGGPGELLEPCDDPDDCATTLSCADGLCRSGAGSGCDLDGDCADRNCECNNSPCTARTCTAADCVCGYGPAGACQWPMNGGITDPEDCEPARSCVGGDCIGE